MDRRAFLDQEPPPGYVAGVGRGATGFVTGGDSGGIRTQRLFEQSDSEGEEPRGGEEGLLASKASKDDEEADKVYNQVEARLQKRRKEVKEVEVVEDNKIKEQFSDLKRDLASVTADDWTNLPEAADLTKRNKRTRLLEQSRQRFYATPDNILAAQASTNGSRFKLETPAENESDLVDDIEADNMMADIQRNRQILASLRRSEPNKPSSWIASARLEIQAKNFNTAKKLISEGCAKVPHNEEIWLESIKIHQNSVDGVKMAKVIVTEALRYNSNYENLWLKACDCENSADKVSQRRVLMKGLEFVPSSVKLWERLIELQEEEDDVKKILGKVVELCPTEWKFWLSLINLSEYGEAKKLINQARKAMKDNYHIWITAAKIEERGNKDITSEKLIKVLEKGMKQLKENTADDKLLSRRAWLEEAAKAESETFFLTCKAIVANAIDIATEESTRQSVQFEEASYFAAKNSPKTANFIYEHITNQNPSDFEGWVKFFSAFKATNPHVTEIYRYYEKAISCNKTEPLFRLMYAKDMWKLENNIDGARKILNTALKELSEDEEIWHANIKFEARNGNFTEASMLSNKMIEEIPNSSARVWLKHIHLQRYIHSQTTSEETKKPLQETILSIIDTALDMFPEEEKLHLQKGQVLVDFKDIEQAKEVFSIAINKIPKSTLLWLHLAEVYEKHLGIMIRARSILDSAIVKIDDDRLWVAKIDIERRNKDMVAARQLCNRALKQFNSSPILWLQYLSLIPKMSQRKNAFLEALRATDNSPVILLNIGVFFWVDGKIAKAKSWFERALANDPQNGDIWGWLNNFYTQHGTTEELKAFIQHFNKEKEHINRGTVWNSAAKKVQNFLKEPEEILPIVSSELKNIPI